MRSTYKAPFDLFLTDYIQPIIARVCNAFIVVLCVILFVCRALILGILGVLILGLLADYIRLIFGFNGLHTFDFLGLYVERLFLFF